MATLLLVILIPRLLPPQYIPLGLGLHKSMEMASSSLSQTLAGLWLDWTKKTADDEDDEYEAGEGLLRLFWAINILQVGCIVLLWKFEARRRARVDQSRIARAEEYEQLPMASVSDISNSAYDDDDEEDEEEDQDRDRDLNKVTSDTEDDVNGESGYDSQDPEGEVKQSRPRPQEMSSALALDDQERRRGRRYLYTSLGFIGVVWVVFLASAWSRL